MTRPARTGPTTALAALLALLLAVSLGGCSGDDDRHPAARPSTRGGDPATLHLRTMPTTLRTGVVTGRLPRADRQRVVRAVGTGRRRVDRRGVPRRRLPARATSAEPSRASPPAPVGWRWPTAS